MACAPNEDSDQCGHPPSLIRVFAIGMKNAWVLCYQLSAQRRLWSDWPNALADLSLRWAHMPFFMRWLIFYSICRISLALPMLGDIELLWPLICLLV